MKLRNIFFVAAMCLCLAAMSQVPNEISYQVLVLDPDNGKVLANETAEIRIELRKNTPTGEVAWSETFSATTDKRGMCNLTLSLDDNLDWSNNSYYFAAIINGKECGAPKMTSVPYALCAMSAQTATIATSAHQASTLEGLPTRQQLIGTWCYVNEDGDTQAFIFNEDGTGKYHSDYYNDGYTYTICSWTYYPNGFMYCDVQESSSLKHYLMNFLKISDNQIVIQTNEHIEMGIYTKQ